MPKHDTKESLRAEFDLAVADMRDMQSIIRIAIAWFSAIVGLDLVLVSFTGISEGTKLIVALGAVIPLFAVVITIYFALKKSNDFHGEARRIIEKMGRLKR